MKAEQFKRYVDALPPEVLKEFEQQRGVLRDYLTRAGSIREKLVRQFPEMSPRIRAAISLAIARIL
ncbi:MAG: hypothetical protein ACOY0T_27055 [Myxococcota bacterium]